MFVRIMELYLLLLVTAVWNPSAARDCNLDDELKCLTTDECIHKMQWCDRVADCEDHSDENYCYVASCPTLLFRCNSGKCIPDTAVCDGFDNCGDGSDEICNRVIEITEQHPKYSYVDDISFPDETSSKTDSVTKAAGYLLMKRQTDNGWYNFTPRAIVALAFAERAGNFAGKWISPLKKELNIKILINLMQSKMKPRLCDLSHYINALYATCQDPRNFQGIDLVKLLRSEVNTAKKMDLPLVFLTLCIAKETNHEDTQTLLDMYDHIGNDRLGSKALVIMSLACISRTTQSGSSSIRRRFNDFTAHAYSLLSSFDIYTKILHIQALNALNYKTETFLLPHQQPDGSFGDLLATYYAIPVLLNSSLLDLRCEGSKKYEELPMTIRLPKHSSKLKKVTYSLWIEMDSYIQAHSVIVSLEGNKTFYDVMKMAEAEDPIFRFLYDSSIYGKNIYSIAGIPNDPEIGKAWNLYHGKESNVIFPSKERLIQRIDSVDRIFPRKGDHFVFWYERSFG